MSLVLTAGSPQFVPVLQKVRIRLSYLAGLHLRASMIWINDLLKATG